MDFPVRLYLDREVGNPVISLGTLAQLVEHQAFNLQVLGSSPRCPTIPHSPRPFLRALFLALLEPPSDPGARVPFKRPFKPWGAPGPRGPFWQAQWTLWGALPGAKALYSRPNFFKTLTQLYVSLC
tara:strand:+ start:1051 stop:1428 length:378 start_codon:yes stop_codon:yes gene_type:complete